MSRLHAATPPTSDAPAIDLLPSAPTPIRVEIADTIEVTRAFEWASLLGPAIVLVGVAIVVVAAGIQFRRELAADRLQLTQQLTVDRIKHAELLEADRKRFGEQIEADHRARVLSWRSATDAEDRRRVDILELERRRAELDLRIDAYAEHLAALDRAIAQSDELLPAVTGQRPRKVARRLISTEATLDRHDTCYTRVTLVASEEYVSVAGDVCELLDGIRSVDAATSPRASKRHRRETITELHVREPAPCLGSAV